MTVDGQLQELTKGELKVEKEEEECCGLMMVVVVFV